MQATPQRQTTPEVRLQSMLRSAGVRFTTDARPLPALRRTADIVLRRLKIAVFVDGCFWHGCPAHCTWPTHNRAWWRAKIARTRARDHDTDVQLRAAGWAVIRIWEHAVNPRAIQRILVHVAKQAHGHGPARRVHRSSARGVTARPTAKPGSRGAAAKPRATGKGPRARGT